MFSMIKNPEKPVFKIFYTKPKKKKQFSQALNKKLEKLVSSGFLFKIIGS